MSCWSLTGVPKYKYKIHVRIRDNTGETTLVLFNVVAGKLLYTSALKLFNRLPLDSNDVPPQIQSLCEKDCFFKLRLNNYNLKEGLENFTISKLFIPDESMELRYRLRKEKKGKSTVENIIKPKQPKAEGFIEVKTILFTNLFRELPSTK